MPSKRKHHRNLAKCKAYKEQGRRVRNKIRKLVRHLKRLPNDVQAKESLRGLK